MEVKTDRNNIIGGVKYRYSNLYYDENGIPWMSKEQADRCITGRNGWKRIVSVSDEVNAELAEVVKQDFISTNGQSIPEGSRRNDVINKYLNSLPSKQRSSASWTLDQMAGVFAARMEQRVRENNPEWKPENTFDTSILDQLEIHFFVSSMINGISLKRRYFFKAISMPTLPFPSGNGTMGIQKLFVNFPITVSFTTLAFNRTFTL